MKALNWSVLDLRSSLMTAAGHRRMPVAPLRWRAQHRRCYTAGKRDPAFVLHGTWVGLPAPTFSYQWHRVTVVEAPEAPANLTAPAIADLTPQVGETLHTTDGTWAGSPAPTLSYQWHRVTVAAPEASFEHDGASDRRPHSSRSARPSIPLTEPGRAIPRQSFGYQWHRVTADPVAPSGGTPSIADTTPVQGETLHCDHGTWAGDTPITYAYQWKRDTHQRGHRLGRLSAGSRRCDLQHVLRGHGFQRGRFLHSGDVERGRAGRGSGRGPRQYWGAEHRRYYARGG